MDMVNRAQIIEKIEIKRFRSFGRVDIYTDVLNVYSGRNNSGKSNILKALNLFFNQESNFGVPYDHELDYNKAFRRSSSSGKTDVEITIHFHPVGNGALKDRFCVKRIFSANSDSYKQELRSDNDAIQDLIEANNGKITSQYTKFLNKLEYIYIPAVRDKNFIKSFLTGFDQIIRSSAVRGSEFDDAVTTLSNVLENESVGVSEEFEKYIGMPAKARLSSNNTDLLSATEISVESGVQVKNKSTRKKDPGKIVNIPIDLFSSGDGIVMSYLVRFLDYLTKKSKKNYIWGFEEPENSLEYSLVQSLAQDFLHEFTKNAQIFITTHSPAFINLMHEPGVEFYRVYIPPQSEEEKSKNLPDKHMSRVQKLENIREHTLSSANDRALTDALNEELHLVEQAQEIEKAVAESRKEAERLRKENERLAAQYKDLSNSFPEKIFICEDENAIPFWKKLFEQYNIKNVKIFSSSGCTSNDVEKWIVGQTKISKKYSPKVFREVDSDGYLEEQKELIRSEYKDPGHGIKYRYEFLPFNELENIVVMDEKLCPDDIFTEHLESLRDSFERTAYANLEKHHKVYSSVDVNNVFPAGKDRTKKMQAMWASAKKDWRRLLPGKDILKKIENHDPVDMLMDQAIEKMPPELDAFLKEIKAFFN